MPKKRCRASRGGVIKKAGAKATAGGVVAAKATEAGVVAVAEAVTAEAIAAKATAETAAGIAEAEATGDLGDLGDSGVFWGDRVNHGVTMESAGEAVQDACKKDQGRVGTPP